MSLIDDFRNGKRYGTDWKAPTVQHMNNLVETISIDDLIVKSISSMVDTSEVDNYGTASVAMVGEGTTQYLKFKNLKGKGLKSIDYTSTDSIGNRIYTLTLDDGTTRTIQSDRGTGYNPRDVWKSGVTYVRDANIIDTVFYEGTSYYCKVSHTSSSSILPTNTAYWGILCEKGQAPDIVDNLTTTDASKALSANQGKILVDKIDEAVNNIKNGTTQVGDSKKIYGVDLKGNTVASFGEYKLLKLKILFEGNAYLSSSNNSINLSEELVEGSEYLLVLQMVTGLSEIEYKPFIATSAGRRTVIGTGGSLSGFEHYALQHWKSGSTIIFSSTSLISSNGSATQDYGYATIMGIYKIIRK